MPNVPLVAVTTTCGAAIGLIVGLVASKVKRRPNERHIRKERPPPTQPQPRHVTGVTRAPAAKRGDSEPAGLDLSEYMNLPTVPALREALVGLEAYARATPALFSQLADNVDRLAGLVILVSGGTVQPKYGVRVIQYRENIARLAADIRKAIIRSGTVPQYMEDDFEALKTAVENNVENLKKDIEIGLTSTK